MSIGNRLREARKARSLTQHELSDISGVPQSSISKLERGDQQSTTYSIQLAKALEINPVWLEMGTEPMSLTCQVEFNNFLTRCFMFVIAETRNLKPSINQITQLSKSLYQNGKKTQRLDKELFNSLVKLLK